MRFRIYAAILAVGIIVPVCQSQVASRNVDAVVTVQRSLAMMGGTPPADLTATGSATVTAGGRVEHGTVRILTRGLDESRFEIDVPSGNTISIYSGAEASESLNGGATQRSAELGATAQAATFPLFLLSALVGDQDVGIDLLPDTASTSSVRIRTTKMYVASPSLQYLSAFSERILEFDSSTGLLTKVSYNRRAARGAEAAIAIQFTFSDYRPAGTFLFPYHIQESLNDTPWADIAIESVSFNTGISDAEFKTH